MDRGAGVDVQPEAVTATGQIAYNKREGVGVEKRGERKKDESHTERAFFRDELASLTLFCGCAFRLRALVEGRIVFGDVNERQMHWRSKLGLEGREKKGKESGARRGNLREGDLLGGAVCSGRGGCSSW